MAGHPRPQSTKLSLGGCRFYHDCEKKCDHNLPSKEPIFIVSRKQGVSLCQMEPSSNSKNMPLRLCFQDRVNLVALKDNKEDLEGCIDFVRKNTLQQYKISWDDDEDAARARDRNLKHQFATIDPDIALDPADTNYSFCGFSTNIAAITLLSIGLRQNRDFENRDPSVLSLARRKRELNGIYVVFQSGEITTKVTLEDEEGDEVCYLVEYVTARRSNAKGFLYFILPSTMVTLLPAKESEITTQKITNTTLVAPKIDANTDSPVTHHLIRTVRYLRGSSRASVSKSCLLSGPPGVGKTYSVKQAYNVCREEGPTILLSLGSLLGSGDTPSQVSRLLQKRFEKAAEDCNKDNDCVAIVFLDECDALLSTESVAGMLAALLDRTVQEPEGWQRIMVVAATNHKDKLPAYLRRPGRFDNEINVAPPTAGERFAILKSLIDATTNMTTLGPESLRDLAELCVGYVAADLVALVRRVLALALEENRDSIDLDLFRTAMMDVRASALRDSSLAAPPKTQWSDIAGDPGGAQKILRQAIEWPRTKREAFNSLGLQPPKGILLYGPPGCAKTTLARAGAGAAGSAFIAFAPSDVYASSYVGEAESTVRNAFRLARSTSPCILFFDEIDAIIGNEGDEAKHGMNRSQGGSSAESRVLSTFLNEMDGIDGSWEDGVIVLAATNRPWTLDKALLRSGRFDKAIYVPPPDYEGRLSIFKMFTSNVGKELEFLARDEVSGSMTGAEIVGACRSAGMRAFKDTIGQGGEEETNVEVTLDHLKEALSATQPLLSEPGYLNAFLEFERSRLRL